MSSSFGPFAHFFSSIGERSFRRFLLDVSFDYLMGKFLGVALHQFDIDASLKFMRDFVRKRRIATEIDARTAREVWNSLRLRKSWDRCGARTF